MNQHNELAVNPAHQHPVFVSEAACGRLPADTSLLRLAREMIQGPLLLPPFCQSWCETKHIGSLLCFPVGKWGDSHIIISRLVPSPLSLHLAHITTFNLHNSQRNRCSRSNRASLKPIHRKYVDRYLKVTFCLLCIYRHLVYLSWQPSYKILY